METYINQLIFGVGPYLAGTIFLLGSFLRYERGQYTWRAMSSQTLSNPRRSAGRASRSTWAFCCCSSVTFSGC